jgi:hypothetical protein
VYARQCLNPRQQKPQQQKQNPGSANGNHSKKPSFQVKQSQLNFMGNISIREPSPLRLLLSNLGTRFCLRGVGCDARGFKLASLTLMAELAKSNRLTLVKPRTTWDITSKTEPSTPNDPLDQVKTPLWSILGQRHDQTPLKH